MRDGVIRRGLKFVARVITSINLYGTRAILRALGEKPHLLGGQCGKCAQCCEAPGIQVGRLTWYFPTLRRLFLAWHRHVNGFVLVDRVIAQRTFVFRCTHFDPGTRRCDSYESRPLMCRDYPRALLWQAAPTFLPGCGYKPVACGAARMMAALEKEGLPPEKLDKVKAKLHLDE